MVSYTRPPPVGRIKNYTILDLDGEFEDVKVRWLGCLRDFRSWCFNCTDNRYQFGSQSHRCAMIPEKGHFFVYLQYKGKWMTLVIQGSTSYLIGFITSSVGRQADLRVREISNQGKQVRYIEGSRKMKWHGNYIDAESTQVGAGPLRSAFCGMYKYTSEGLPRPSENEVAKWCGIFVIHFPEAGRFDSLGLCNIYKRFVNGGRVGLEAIDKAQNWSSDCRGAHSSMTLTKIPDKKWKVKKGSKAEINKRKSLSVEVKKGKRMTNNEVEEFIKDVRLFHRSFPIHETASLSSMPVQLNSGELVGSFPDDLDRADAEMEFLIQPVLKFSHDACGYAGEKWVCKTLSSDNANQSTLVVKKGHSAGLYNLGNTCYMNSTLQCLHSVPELKSALLSYSDIRGNGVDQASHNLTIATRNTFGELDQRVGPVAPQQFLETLREKYPEFAQQHNNVYMQQDAEECWTQLVRTLSQTLTSESSESAAVSMKALFGIDLTNRDHCAESGEECFSTESVYSLKCHIAQDVNHLHEGLEHGLKTELQKVSAALCRTAIYTRESRIKELPRYLTVQFTRLIWKSESNQKEKVLRKVDYPLELDVYEFCSDELKQKLQALRQMLRGAEYAKIRLEAKGKVSSSKENVGSSSNIGESSSMDIDKAEPSVLKNTGVYDLNAVLTHRGSGDSGHYVGWVKQDDGKWIEFDDDNPNICKEEDVLKLSGGGEGEHMAYTCLYKARVAE